MSEARRVIREAAGSADMALVRALFVEYADWLALDLCFQGFAEELQTLPGLYAPPRGGLWLAEVGLAAAGVVGVRPLDDRACELKRLWIRPQHRGLGLGRRLAETAVAAARSAGYDVMRLDTIGPRMAAARAVYLSLGFVETAPYYSNPHEDVTYLELKLAPASGIGRPGAQGVGHP